MFLTADVSLLVMAQTTGQLPVFSIGQSLFTSRLFTLLLSCWAVDIIVIDDASRHRASGCVKVGRCHRIEHISAHHAYTSCKWFWRDEKGGCIKLVSGPYQAREARGRYIDSKSDG
jgi:hypothetical protein